MSLAGRIGAALLVPAALLVGLAAGHLAMVERLIEANRTIARVTHEVDSATIRLRDDLVRLSQLAEKSRVLDDTEYAAEANRTSGRVTGLVVRLGEMELSAEERRRLDRVERAWQAYRAALGADLTGDPAGNLETLLAEVDGLAVASRARAEEIVEQGERSAERGGRAARLVTMGGVAVALGLALILGRAILSPVRRLARGTREIAAGRFDHRVEAVGPRELAALAEDFNHMAERLAELDRLKEDLLSSVSHDLKAPLASMQETGRLLLEGLPGPLNERQRRLVELNLLSAERLSAMIGNLLDLARLDSGVPLEPEEFDSADLARTAIAELSGLARERGVSVSADLPLAPVSVRWDAVWMVQLLENLLSNAIRHAPPGTAVDVAVKMDGDDTVVLEVRDRGPGVPDAHKERVFERFYRLDAKGRGKVGTGLGLAIVRSIARGHGGDVRVEDAEGGGARFVARLPIHPPVGAVSSLAPGAGSR